MWTAFAMIAKIVESMFQRANHGITAAKINGLSSIGNAAYDTFDYLRGGDFSSTNGFSSFFGG